MKSTIDTKFTLCKSLLFCCLLLWNLPFYAQSGEQCYVSSSLPTVAFAKAVWHTNGDTITIRTTLSRKFVDNTYGTTAIGWPNGHKFGDLVGSDNLQLSLLNTAGSKILEFKLDYITSSTLAPSGYKCLGVSGGEGRMLVGTASNIYGASSSIDVNLNKFGYKLLTNSPQTNADYAINSTYPNWIFEVWYEVKVKKSAFGSLGFLRPLISGIHASPSKLGTNTVVVSPQPCPVGSLGDRVWQDDNRNGIQDAGEPGVPGVTVKLYSCPGNILLGTDITDEQGKYLFENLEVDKGYYVVFDKSSLPDAAEITKKDQGGSDANDSDADPVTGQTGCETITVNENNLSYDAGIYIPRASIGNFVWEDTNMDGKQDVSETGISGVVVYLYNCTGSLKGSTATDADGFYLFDNVVPGNYYISFESPGEDYVPSPANQDTGEANDSDANPVTGNTVCEILDGGENNLTYDAGFFRCSVTITCPPALTVLCIDDVPEPSIGIVSSFGTCDDVSVEWMGDDVSGTRCLSYLNRTYKATDQFGYTATCEQIITVHDTEKPVLSGITHKTVSCSDDDNPEIPSANDNCDNAPIVVKVSDVSSQGNCEGFYTRTVVWKAVDNCGNESAPLTQVITIRDLTPPTIGNAGNNAKISCNEDAIFTAPFASDNCDSSPSVVLVSDVTTPGSCPGTYTRNKRWKAVDCSGNESGTVSQSISIVDTKAPVIGSPGASVTVYCPASPVFTAPFANDECDASPSIVLVSDITTPGNCPGVFSRTKIWKAVDCSGNESTTVSQTIHVIDNLAPVLGNTGTGTTLSCEVVPVFSEPSATDNCDSSPDVVLVSDVTTPGSCPGSYTRTKTWKAVDCSGNESATRSQSITVQDVTPPALGTAGPNTTISCPATPVFTTPSGTDNCDTAPAVILVSDVTTSGNCPGTYTRTKTWKAVDCSGNESTTRSQSVTVQDITAPIIGNAGPNKTLACGSAADFTPPTVSDECGNAELVLVSETTDFPTCSQGFAGTPSSMTRTWKARDCSGNESPLRSQTIYFDCCVEDTPSICLTSTTNPSKVGGLITVKTNGDTLTVRVIFNKTFVDNTYGTSAVGWPNGHTFSNLTGSDKLQLAMFDKAGSKKLEFEIDYISASAMAPSGYKCLGVTGGDGGMILGSASSIYSAVTSMDRNMNAFGYVLTTNSPATDINYTPNPSYPNWIYEVWYEVKVKKSSFGESGFGKPVVTSIHASPSKTGNNTEPVVECKLVSVAVTDEQCSQACSGSILLTAIEGKAPYQYKWNDNSTEEDRINICPGVYMVTVTDANRSTYSAQVTVNAAPEIPCPEQNDEICFESPTKPAIVNARSTWYENGDTVTIRTTLSKTFVDNTYGTGAIGWTKGHKFGDLTGSDQLTVALFDKNKSKKLEFAMDYLSSAANAPSGFKSLGVSGGDGKMILGTAANIYRVVTSLDVNFNTYGYKLTTNSPTTNSLYTPNLTYPKWIYEVWYEVKVKKSAFGNAGFGYPVITSMHASPSKTGNNSETVIIVDCASNSNSNEVAGRSVEETNHLLSVYPNPSSGIVTIDYTAITSALVIMTLSRIDGSDAQIIFREPVISSQRYQLQADLGGLSSGIYILKVQNGKDVSSQKIIIQP